MRAKSLPCFLTLQLLCILYLCSSANAYMPPTPDIDEAIKTGKAMFVGRVVKISEKERENNRTGTIADIELIQCYVGIKCQKGDKLFISYISDSLEESVLGIDFKIGREYLFIMQKPIENKEAYFNTDLVGGCDMAFEILIEDYPYLKNIFLSGDKGLIILSNAYLPKHRQRISKKELVRMILEKIPKKNS